MVEELLGIKTSIKNLTISEYSEYVHAKYYSDKVLTLLV